MTSNIVAGQAITQPPNHISVHYERVRTMGNSIALTVEDYWTKLSSTTIPKELQMLLARDFHEKLWNDIGTEPPTSE